MSTTCQSFDECIRGNRSINLSINHSIGNEGWDSGVGRTIRGFQKHGWEDCFDSRNELAQDPPRERFLFTIAAKFTDSIPGFRGSDSGFRNTGFGARRVAPGNMRETHNILRAAALARRIMNVVSNDFPRRSQTTNQDVSTLATKVCSILCLETLIPLVSRRTARRATPRVVQRDVRFAHGIRPYLSTKSQQSTQLLRISSHDVFVTKNASLLPTRDAVSRRTPKRAFSHA